MVSEFTTNTSSNSNTVNDDGGNDQMVLNPKPAVDLKSRSK